MTSHIREIESVARNGGKRRGRFNGELLFGVCLVVVVAWAAVTVIVQIATAKSTPAKPAAPGMTDSAKLDFLFRREKAREKAEQDEREWLRKFRAENKGLLPRVSQ